MIMATQAGLWIDHRKAVIVLVSEAGETTTVIESNVEKHPHFSVHPGVGEPHGSRAGAPEDTRERHFEGELAKYYDDVLAHVRAAEGVLIFGPGEAKGELKGRFDHHGLASRIVGVETADKMTDPQIVAKVRQHFAG
jgi:hypothetical protein